MIDYLAGALYPTSVQGIPKIDMRLETRMELRPIESLRDLRHDLASVASALETILNSKHLKVVEPASEIVRLSLDKVLKSLECVDDWIEAAES